MSTLCLIRHGQASAHSDDYDQLSPVGYVQSQRLGEGIASQFSKVDHIWVGPCKRHIQTYESMRKDHWPEAALNVAFLDEFPAFMLMQLGLDQLCERRPELIELVGSIDGKLGADGSAFATVLQAVTQEWVRGNILHPQIISGPAYIQRLKDGLDLLLSHQGVQLIVTSTGTVSSLLGLVLEADVGRAIRCAWGLQNASISIVKYRGVEDRYVASMNNVSHLSPDLLTYL
jgi:broad specificity phosphatase PhoE